MAEEIHGDWQHMPAELAGLADGDVGAPDDDTALAVGGEGAVELEATAPGGKTEVLRPLTAEEREAMRKDISTDMDRPHVDINHLVSGPNGQMISGHNR